MISVNNASGLSSRAPTGARGHGAPGAGSGSSDVSSHEPLTYAHLDASRFSHENLNDKALTIQGRAPGNGEPVSRSGFGELMEANARAMAAASAAARSQEAPRQTAGGRAQGQGAAAREPSFSISMVGGQIQLAFNPNSRRG